MMAVENGITVKELIGNLQEYDEEAKVSFWLGPSTQLEILSIYSGDLKAGPPVGFVEEKPESDPDVCIDMETM
jgi:hypothetical protein